MATKFTPPQEKEISKLLMDAKNPRIPEEKQSLSQDELVIFVAETYNSIAIAESIASHNYFPSEPLIAIDNKNGTFTVVEGNRRLAALKLLLNPKLKTQLATHDEWDKISTTKIPDKVPVMTVKDRKDVAPLIGYRHISGIQPWDPYSKARYIAAQIEEGGLTFRQTAIEVGEKESEVKANYRDYRISEQVTKLGVGTDNVNDMMNNFGVFTRAMQSPDLRDFIGAPSPDKVTTSKSPIPAKKVESLVELTGYLFGPKAVLEDSRDLTKLGKIITSPDGLKTLRAENNLEMAHAVSGGIRDRLVNKLSNAARSLRSAKDDLLKYKKDSDVKKLLEECKEALEELEEIQKK